MYVIIIYYVFDLVILIKNECLLSKARDKLYKIKKITNTEENFVVENDTESMESTAKPKTSSSFECNFSTKSRSNKKNTANYGLDDLSDKNSESESEATIPKLNKNKAVSEYKAAMNCFGSKSSAGSFASCGSIKKAIDKVVVSEAEYNNVNDWLINDIEKKPSSSTKRKLKENYDENSNIDDDLSNLTFDEETVEKNNTDDEIDEIMMSHNAKSKKYQAKKNEIINSPISKRRNIDTFSGNADKNNRQNDLFEENDSQSSSSSVVLANFNNNRSNEPKSILKKSKGKS